MRWLGLLRAVSSGSALFAGLCVLVCRDEKINIMEINAWSKSLYKFKYLVTDSADPDQLASEEANWSGSTLFAKAGYILFQQDKG